MQRRQPSTITTTKTIATAPIPAQQRNANKNSKNRNWNWNINTTITNTNTQHTTPPTEHTLALSISAGKVERVRGKAMESIVATRSQYSAFAIMREEKAS